MRQVPAALQVLSPHELSLSPAAHQPGRGDPPQLPLLSQSVQWETGDPRLAGEDFPRGDVGVEANTAENLWGTSSPCSKQSSSCASPLNALAAEMCLEIVLSAALLMFSRRAEETTPAKCCARRAGNLIQPHSLSLASLRSVGTSCQPV